jgi:hypothetical protein
MTVIKLMLSVVSVPSLLITFILFVCSQPLIVVVLSESSGSTGITHVLHIT